MKHKSLRYKIFTVFNTLFLLLVMVACAYPFINTLAIALNDSTDSLKGGLTFFPRVFTLDNFKFVLGQASIQKAFVVTVARGIIVTALTVILQFAGAYALSKQDLPGRKFLFRYFMIPMFLTAGIIPKYILYGTIGIMNTFWVYILPNLFSFYYLVVIRANIKSIPESLFESARLDGAGETRILFKIVIPLSLPVLATIALWTSVSIWSDWATTLYFASTNEALYTLQYYIRLFMIQSQIISEMIQRGIINGGVRVTPVALQAAQVMITTIPIVCVYPFVQKYFIKGVITGSIKE